MRNLDLYAKAEHLLGIEEATEALHTLYESELEEYGIETLLDFGCGRGGFMKRMMEHGISCKGIDLSSVMVAECQKDALDAECISIDKIAGSYDAIVAIFDVLNFLDKDELMAFLESASAHLNDGGVLIADINTKYGFSDVAQGEMSSESDDEFLIVDAVYEDEKLVTKFTLFEKNGECYKKEQESIVQYFHKVSFFEKIPSLKLKEKQTFSLYDTKDKVLLVLTKR